MDKTLHKMHAELCKVFTSPVRIEILDILRGGKKSVSDLVKLTGLNQSNISQHLQIMKDKGIVRSERKGNFIYYSLVNSKISKAFKIMKEILKQQLAEKGDLYNKFAKE